MALVLSSSLGWEGLTLLLPVVLVVFCIIRLLISYIKWRTSPVLTHVPGPGRNSYFLGEFKEIKDGEYMEPELKWWEQVKAQHAATNGGTGAATTPPPLMAYSTLLGDVNLFIMDLDLAKTIFTSDAKVDPVRFPKHTLLSKEVAAKSLPSLDGSQWHRHRKIIQPSFYTKALQDTMNKLVPARTQQFIESWHKSKPGRLVDANTHMQAITMDVIGLAAFSHDFKTLQSVERWAMNDEAGAHVEEAGDKFVSSVQEALKPKPLMMGLYMLEQLWMNKHLDPSFGRTMNMIDEAVEDIIQVARKKTEESTKLGERSLLQLLLNANDAEPSKGGGKTLNQAELRDEVKMFLLAGQETTAGWCTWCLYCLAKYPDIQEKVFQDIVKHASNNKSVPIDLDTVAKMKYFDAFMSEVLRMYPPFGKLSRKTAKDENLKGYHIPAGTKVFFPVYLYHHDPQQWHKPWEFRPERWLDEKEMKARHFYSYIPFAAGVRNCVGQNFAQYEAKLIMANLIRSFAFQLPADEAYQNIKLKGLVIMKSEPAITVTFKPRP